MPKKLDNAKVKLENVERQLETAKAEVTKPFAQETELKEKLDRLSVLNALLNMDETGSVAQVNNETSEQLNADTLEQDNQKAEQPELESNNARIMQIVVKDDDKFKSKASLKEKLDTYKTQVSGVENAESNKIKGKEAVI